MNKREIFKRLQNIRDYARVTDTWPHDNAEQQNLHLRNAVEAIAKDLGDLLLDIAAPEEEKREEVKAVKEPALCPKCGKVAVALIADGIWCSDCGAMPYESKRVDDAPKTEEKHPGIIVDPSGKNPPHCLKCGGEAKIHHNLFAVGDEWVMCEKCIAMFRVKPDRGEVEKETFEAKPSSIPTCPECGDTASIICPECGAFASPSLNSGEWWCPKHGVFQIPKA